MKSLLIVIEEGSVNRAAKRLGVAQPTISRHIQTLEQELGAQLFERGAWGMRPTDFGFFIKSRFTPLVKDYEIATADALAYAKGRHDQLRIGFIGSAAAKFLNPALSALKRELPELKLFLFDQTPYEQLRALRNGEIDIAMMGHESVSMNDEFYMRRIAKLKVHAVLPSDHPLSASSSLTLAELKDERFVGVEETAVPGRNAWIASVCKKSGFRPRFASHTSSVSETYALVSGENAVSLIPDYVAGALPPGVAFVSLSDRYASWDFMVLRQRGSGSSGAKRLVNLMTGL